MLASRLVAPTRRIALTPAIAQRSFYNSALRLQEKKPVSGPSATPVTPPSPVLKTEAVTKTATTPVATGSAGTPPPPPPPSPKKKWGFWKTTWRITYGSVFATLIYAGWSIYETRHPRENQSPPDPTKKTLVILGSGWGSVSLLKTINTSNYNVVVVSPRNFFLFTPLLPSCTTGTIEHRSIMEPIRGIIRNKESDVTYYEAEATKIDYENRVVTIRDHSTEDSKDERQLKFDYLVVGVGAMNSTFGIPGVQDHACFLKEIPDAQKIRKKIMDCIESASFKNLDDADRKRLLHTVVVGGGPTGVEFAAELQDFFEEDLKKWIPGIAKDFKVTLVEALPNVLPSFSKQLIDYTERQFKAEKISVLTKTMVKKVTEDTIIAEATRPDGSKETLEMPYGLLVWATGNTVRPVIRDLMANLEAQKNSRRGLLVNEYLVVEGTEGVWALGDCTATKYAPTAQVAAQQGSYLGGLFNQLARAEDLEQEVRALEAKASQTAEGSAERKSILSEIESRSRRLRRSKSLLPFEYSHQGSLAYVGSDKAVADLTLWAEGNFASGGRLTYMFWRSAYLSMCFSMRNKILVLTDWVKVKVFGRDVSRE
ncbi:NADH-ubiquinone reductase (H(+)-translocating) NDE1 [Sugiyamaella lignohabitans]|uniref:NADH:ubiquinone reductase (non-electrogenic) n=1 Tax=Sugiyamaella lignohabitans TaxID=796027 RepID=A0A167D6R4_9ASCO|nr:NADH-ubiquinone reductase (H(+)-translocating) NDE1 [Sugiyamaella lignohabitans]ANB12549.1 NADH-ubiquinone reductase (H(+)-translocating) NDE1 [Sugiyamaella lignohabitans]